MFGRQLFGLSDFYVRNLTNVHQSRETRVSVKHFMVTILSIERGSTLFSAKNPPSLRGEAMNSRAVRIKDVRALLIAIAL